MRSHLNVLFSVLAAVSLALAAEWGDAEHETGSAPRAILASSSTVGASSADGSRFPSTIDPIAAAHAILGCMAFGFFFPLGAVLVRVLSDRYRIAAHVWCQIYALAMALSAAGLGIYMAITTKSLLESHALMGMVAAGGVLLQPIFGTAHHWLFSRLRRRTAVSYLHIFWGIGFVTLGIVDGGLGLQLADQEQWKIIMYGIIVALIWVGWMLVSVLELGRKRREDELANEDEEKLAMSGANGGVWIPAGGREGSQGSSNSSNPNNSEPTLSTLTPSTTSSPRSRPVTSSTGTGVTSLIFGTRLSTLMSSLSGRSLSSRGTSTRGLSTSGGPES
ncbi:hypothetical protein GQ53DRAFT_820724 [Thozetella sp. PMI_491]|nr:hypothetical protein GQ53DRAFT_820724 [Thozetella sp. PMI_491]